MVAELDRSRLSVRDRDCVPEERGAGRVESEKDSKIGKERKEGFDQILDEISFDIVP